MGRPFDAGRLGPDNGDGRTPPKDRTPRRRFEVLEVLKDVHSRFSMDVDKLRITTREGEQREKLHPRFEKQATQTALALNGTIVGIREYVYGTNQRNFETAGGVRGDKDTEQAAKNKVQEELGITASKASIVPLAIIRSDTGTYNVTNHFLADVETVGEPPEDQPTIQREDVPSSEIRTRVLDGRINTANIALQALLTADHLEATGKLKPTELPKQLILPGGRGWMEEVPDAQEPWKMTALEANADGTPVDQRGGLAVLERSIKEETDSEQLVHDHVLKPDPEEEGKFKEADQYTVNYPRQTHIIPVDIASGQVYLLREESYSYGEEVYTLPSDRLQDGESYGDAAKRVAQQEFDIEPANNQLYNLGVKVETSSRFNYQTRFVGMNVTAEMMKDKSDYVAVDIDEAWDAVKGAMDKTDQDGKTIPGKTIDGIKLDTLTPALAVGLLKNTQLQPVT